MKITPKQAAELLGISVPTLRRWSKQFTSFLSPGARPGKGKHRSYTQGDMAVMARAKGLLEAGLTYQRVAGILAGEGEYSGGRSLVPTPSGREEEALIPIPFQEALARALELASQRNTQLAEAIEVLADQKAAIQELEERLEELEMTVQQAGSSQDVDRLRTRLDILERWQGRSWLARLFGWW